MAFLTSVFNTVREPLLMLDADLRVVLANRSFYDIFETNPQDTEGREIFTLGDGQWDIPALRTLLERVLPGNTHFDDSEVRHRFEKTGDRIMLLNARKLFHDGDKIFLAIEDVTKIDRAQEKLRASEERYRALYRDNPTTIFTSDAGGKVLSVNPLGASQLGSSVQELEAFSYSVSHDLRSPLRAMQGYSRALLEDNADQLDESGKLYLTRIERAAGRLDHLGQDILAYSRAARTDLPLATVNPDVLIEDVIQHYPALQPPRAKITVQKPLLSVLGNEGSLTQCLSNLLANAVKLVGRGVQPRVQIRTEPIGQQVRLWIEDNGIGIDPAHFERIFTIFGRNPDQAFKGTGIGLAIVKKAVERMGGTLGVESQLGQGSSFWIQLPRAGV